MQPYFFPYLGYFSLIAAVDNWVVFDTSQYTPKTWMNRNRILHPKEGWQYITVPLANSSISIRTCEARVLDMMQAHSSISGKLTHYRRSAPYFRRVQRLVDRVFEAMEDDSLVSLNVLGLSLTCEYLGLAFQYQVLSKSGLELPESLPPGMWALEICEAMGASAYVNPIGGRALFDPAAYQDRGIRLEFLRFHDRPYDTGPYAYQPGLSVLDALLWNSPEYVVGIVRDSVSIESAAHHPS